MRSVILSTFTEHSQHFYTYIMLWYPFTRHSKHLKHFLAIMHTLMSASGAIWGSVCHLRTLHRLQKLGISRWPILPLEMLPNESLTGQLRTIHIRKKNFIIVITIRDLFSAFAWDLSEVCFSVWTSMYKQQTFMLCFLKQERPGPPTLWTAANWDKNPQRDKNWANSPGCVYPTVKWAPLRCQDSWEWGQFLNRRWLDTRL